MPLLFSYGTLQQENVQLATFGRRLAGRADSIIGIGYARSMVEIDGSAVVATSGNSHHPIVRYTGEAGDRVSGTVYEVSADELAAADRYEVAAYRRVEAVLSSGDPIWVYVDARHAPDSPLPDTDSSSAGRSTNS